MVGRCIVTSANNICYDNNTVPFVVILLCSRYNSHHIAECTKVNRKIVPSTLPKAFTQLLRINTQMSIKPRLECP